jgi:hypothetical protein
MKTVQEGDDYRLVIMGRKQKQPNAPGTSQMKHFERANSKRKMRREDFIWLPEGGGRKNALTSVQIGAVKPKDQELPKLVLIPGRVVQRNED